MEVKVRVALQEGSVLDTAYTALAKFRDENTIITEPSTTAIVLTGTRGNLTELGIWNFDENGLNSKPNDTMTKGSVRKLELRT